MKALMRNTAIMLLLVIIVVSATHNAKGQVQTSALTTTTTPATITKLPYGVFVKKSSQGKLNASSPLHRQKKLRPNNAPFATQADTLPFDNLTGFIFDDFAYHVSPSLTDTNQWEVGSGVTVNNSLPVNPLSRGVATFDGLDANGKPYSTIPSSAGACDTLTCKPLALKTYISSASADSAYVSFFWQPGGRAVQLEPDYTDSLVLQYSLKGATKDSGWVSVWRVVGDTNQPFRKVYVNIPVISQFDGFQFRFINYGNRSGLYDLFHIDYVSLYVPVDSTKKEIRDIALFSQPSSLLRNYTAIPWNQLNASGGVSQLADTIYTGITNLNNYKKQTNQLIIPFNIVSEIRNAANNDLLQTIPGTAIDTIPFQGNEVQRILRLSKTKFSIPPTAFALTGPVALKQNFLIAGAAGGGNDFLNNDTISTITSATNYYAYDDGSAELVRWVGGNGAQAAYKFEMAVPDSILSISLVIPSTPQNAGATIPFNLRLWSALTPAGQGNGADVLAAATTFIQVPTDYNTFHEYKFPKPIYGSGTMYAGWRQSTGTENEVRVGCDINTLNNGNFYYNFSTGWQQFTQDNFNLMIRIKTKAGFVISSLADDIQNTVCKIYPNPANKADGFSLQARTNCQYILTNMQGQTMQSGSITAGYNHISNTYNLPTGVYMLRLIGIDATSAPTTIRLVLH